MRCPPLTDSAPSYIPLVSVALQGGRVRAARSASGGPATECERCADTSIGCGRHASTVYSKAVSELCKGHIATCDYSPQVYWITTYRNKVLWTDPPENGSFPLSAPGWTASRCPGAAQELVIMLSYRSTHDFRFLTYIQSQHRNPVALTARTQACAMMSWRHATVMVPTAGSMRRWTHHQVSCMSPCTCTHAHHTLNQVSCILAVQPTQLSCNTYCMDARGFPRASSRISFGLESAI